MRKIAYIIPGHSEDAHSRKYRFLLRFFKERDIRPIPVKITWFKPGNRKTWINYTPSDYYKEFMHRYRRLNRKDDIVYLFGYSAGAQAALMASAAIKPRLTILCSLTPFFSENVAHLPKKWIISSGKKRINDFKRHKLVDFSKKIDGKILFFIGSKEWLPYRKQARYVHGIIKNSTLVVVPNAEHSHMLDKKYQTLFKRRMGDLLDKDAYD